MLATPPRARMHPHASPAFVSSTPLCLRCGTTSHAARRPPFRAHHARMSMDGAQSAGEALVRAAMMGDVMGAQDALAAGAPKGHRSGPAGMTPLMWAASEGNLEMARLLLDDLEKADIDAVTDTGYSALLYAFEGMPNANPRPPPPPGYPMDPTKAKAKPPKQVGIGRRATGHSAIAKLLLVKGADLGGKNQFGEGLLALAARKGQLDWLDLLVQQGLSVQDTCKGYKHTPIHLSALEGHGACVQYLCSLPGAPVDARNVVGWTALLWAAATGSVDCVEFLLEAGADPNVVAAGQDAADGRKTETTALKEARKSMEARAVSKILMRAGARE